MKVHEFEKIVNKLGLKTRNAADRLAWFEYNGQVVVRTKRSHGNKEQPANLIRQQLKVNEKQFSGLISCSVSLQDYIEILKKRNVIAAAPSKTPAKNDAPATSVSPASAVDEKIKIEK